MQFLSRLTMSSRHSKSVRLETIVFALFFTETNILSLTLRSLHRSPLDCASPRESFGLRENLLPREIKKHKQQQKSKIALIYNYLYR